MNLPKGLFSPIAFLIFSAADSELTHVLREVHALAEAYPELLERVDRDLDAHGLKKKAMRRKDRAWRRARSEPLPGGVGAAVEADSSPTRLGIGRPRTPAFVVLVALFLRGYLSAGFKSWDVHTMMAESSSLQVLFHNLGVTPPKGSTLTELVNAVTNATRQFIWDCQLARVLRMKLDSFQTLIGDSTHTKGNTAWPTDSQTLVTLVMRVLHVGTLLERVQLPVLSCPTSQKHLGAMKKLHRDISLAGGGKKQKQVRAKAYHALIWRAKRVHPRLEAAVQNLECALPSLDMLPSRKAAAVRLVNALRRDVDALALATHNCQARVVEDQKVEAKDKIVSNSDSDAAFIAKGQRVPVIGYKPQLVRSGNGFITALLLPQGNAADSGQLLPMVAEVQRRTTVDPVTLSVDDGYASRANVTALKATYPSLEVTSINGAKGKRLTRRADWNSEAYAKARNARSGVEALISTLKGSFDFGEVARRGLDAVYGELLEKCLAYNMCHFIAEKRYQTDLAVTRAA